MKKSNKAVVLGTNYYIGLGTIRCLGKAGIHVVGADYDKSSYGLVSKYVNEFWHIPALSDGDEAIVGALISYARQENCKPVLIPTHDDYVLLLDRNQDRLRPYFLMSLPEQGLAEQVIDKTKLYELAQRHDMPIPPIAQLNDENLETLCNRLLGYPLIVKSEDSPRFVAEFRKKAFVCNDFSEVLWAKKVTEDAGIPCFAQRIVQGTDENMLLFDAYVSQNGDINHIFTGQKLRQWPIKFGASCLIKQKYNPRLIELGTKFFQDIGWRGFAEIEFKQDSETGEVYLIEINARITNFNLLIESCGINVPLLTYQDLVGLPLTPDRLILNQDLQKAFVYGLENYFAKKAYIREGYWTKEHLKSQERGLELVPAIWDKHDIRPALRFVRNKIQSRLGKMNKRTKG